LFTPKRLTEEGSCFGNLSYKLKKVIT
jgi:hypothetical protein